MFHRLALWARQALLPRLSLAHAAAVLLLLASGLANVNYGLMLGHTSLEQTIAVGASIGADLFSAVGFMFAAAAFAGRRWFQGVCASVVLIVTLCYALMAGLSFAAMTRSDLVGPRLAAERTDKITADQFADVRKMIAQLDAKPRMTKHDAAERRQLVTERNRLADQLKGTKTLAAADPAADSIATYLAALHLPVNAGTLQPWFPLLFVLVVVLGGPIAMWLAEGRISQTIYTQPRISQQTPQQTTDAQDQQPLITNDNSPSVAHKPPKLRNVVGLSPLANSTLQRLEKLGGMSGKNQTAVAQQLGMPRTSLRRVLEQLEGGQFVTTSHDQKGYHVRVAA